MRSAFRRLLERWYADGYDRWQIDGHVTKRAHFAWFVFYKVRWLV